MKNLLIRSFLAIAAFSVSHLQAEVQPLNSLPDAIGQSLQQHMIWTAPGAKTESPFLAFRKRFNLRAVPEKATLNLFADVRYLLWINGKYVLRGPARFHPKGPEYDVADVKPFLQTGDNEIAVLVMANQSNGKMMNHPPGLTVRLDAGQKQQMQPILSTDNTWKWSDRTRYRNPDVDWGNVRDRIDSTVEDGDWTQLPYDDSRWTSASRIDGQQWGALSARRIPLLKDTPLEVKLNGMDFPITISAGQEARFQTDYLVQAYSLIDFEADPDTDFDLQYADIHYKAKAGRQIYLSSDTHGFKGGTIKVNSGKITIYSFKPIERIYPFETVGNFHSNDPLLDQLWSVCARSLRVMSEDSYVDCADRERTEWMDDTPPCFDITRTAMAGPGENGAKIYGDPRLLKELLRRTALTLQPDGWVKAHTCSDRFDIHAKMEDRACDWVQGARLYYESTGNAAPIREIWPAIVAQMQYFLDRRSVRGLVVSREWVIWGNPMGYQTAEGAGLNAFIYKALVDAAFLGGKLGKTADSARFEEAAKDLSAAFNRVLWDEKEGTYYSGYDTPLSELPPGVVIQKFEIPSDWHLPPKPAMLENRLLAPTIYPALFALDQGIVPPERREQVTKYLLAQPDPKPRIMFYYFYWKQLYAADEPMRDLFVLNSMRQKWKEMANSPWQTTWEEFGEGSKAHCYGMFPGYFLSAYVLGVRPDGPASGRRILIDPRLGDLSFAEGAVVTEFGLMPVSWKMDSGNLSFKFTVPAGVKATLRLPSGEGMARLTMDTKAIASPAADHSFVIAVGPGEHQGILTGMTAQPIQN